MSTDHYYKLASQTANKYKSNKLKFSQGQIPIQQSNPKIRDKSAHNDYELQNQHQQQNQRYAVQSNRSKAQRDISPNQQNIRELKTQNSKLKKLLKQTQAKRIAITKQCSQLANKYQKLQEQNMQLHRKIKDVKDIGQGDKFRSEELKFLNKQLSVEIQQLRKQNQMLNDKVKHHAEILEKKYQELQSRTYKRIQQALKRIKKGIHYLTSLSSKQIQKTKEIQIQNLSKASQILKGKYNQNKFEDQIEQLMNPIRNIQQQLHQKQKQFTLLKQQNVRLTNEVKKHKKVEKQLLPQYKQAIQKLKKNLGQVRMQLSQNQYQKCQLKKKYQQKNKQTQIKYDQLFKQFRKLKLENKIFQKKIQQMEDDVEQQKQRLMGQNQLLKKLYKSDNAQISKNSLQREIGLDGFVDYQQASGSDLQRQNQQQSHSYKTTANHFHKTKRDYLGLKNSTGQNQQEIQQQKKGQKSRNFLKKNYSASQLRAAISHNTQQIQTQPKKRQNLKLKQPLHEPYQYPQQNASQSRNRNNNNKSIKNYTHLRHTQQQPIVKNNKNTGNANELELVDYYNDNTPDISQKQARKRNPKQHQPLQSYHPNPAPPNNHNNFQLQHYNKHDDQQQNYDEHDDNQGNHSEQIQQSQGYHHDQGSSSLMSASQDGLKNQIFKIDQEIMEIQKTLDRELNMYK